METPALYARRIESRIAESLQDTPVVLFGDAKRRSTWARQYLDAIIQRDVRDDYRLLYYRDADKYEVDVVIENAAGQLVGVEVKAAATVKQSDLRGLRKLTSLAGDQFKMGILLYDGDETMPFGDGIWAAPL
jgi:hypothetical protein